MIEKINKKPKNRMIKKGRKGTKIRKEEKQARENYRIQKKCNSIIGNKMKVKDSGN